MLMVHLASIVLTTVVVIVSMTHLVTNILVNVMQDVIQGIATSTAAQVCDINFFFQLTMCKLTKIKIHPFAMIYIYIYIIVSLIKCF